MCFLHLLLISNPISRQLNTLQDGRELAVTNLQRRWIWELLYCTLTLLTGTLFPPICMYICIKKHACLLADSTNPWLMACGIWVGEYPGKAPGSYPSSWRLHIILPSVILLGPPQCLRCSSACLFSRNRSVLWFYSSTRNNSICVSIMTSSAHFHLELEAEIFITNLQPYSVCMFLCCKLQLQPT